MSENKFETMSAIVDNELDNIDDVEAQLDAILADETLSDTWKQYHLTGDAIRNESSGEQLIDVSQSIADAIALEPTVLAPKAKPSFGQKIKTNLVQFIKPAGQVAIAASAAGLMILGVQQNVNQNEPFSPSQVAQTTPISGITSPVSYNVNQPTVSQKQAYIEQQRRFQALLADHQQQIKLLSQATESEQSPVEEKEAEVENN
ncbi:transcriptional regulator [Thalassotalea sp. LPB0316]|uniref:sigma-E factor negative regulatory protein n=1 Tax=Thalassotalea sp. LPB0316 TaxID=2769490 RepID=UPI0018690F7B|nr:RseA family anti-sigma factor [Thalassotalea sp. LPB0316]QOL25586.1 transcriptional regulator [Thalassotalea sp. LPB0316]